MDKQTRLNEIKKELSEHIAEIVGLLRVKKIVNKKRFRAVHELLKELYNLLHNEKMIERELAGQLFYFFTAVLVEASYTDYSEEIMKELWGLHLRILAVLDENKIEYDKC